MDRDEVEMLFRVKREQVRMMKMRGYDVSREASILDETNFTLQTFRDSYSPIAAQRQTSLRGVLFMIYDRGADDRALVAYVESTTKSKQLGVEPVRGFIAMFQQFQCNHGILISQVPLSKDALEELHKTTARFVQQFQEKEILTAAAAINHLLSPRYEILSEAEALAFFRENNIPPSKMPIIRSSDAVAKYFGVSRGTIIREHNEVKAGETLVDNYRTYSIVD